MQRILIIEGNKVLTYSLSESIDHYFTFKAYVIICFWN